MRKGIYIHVRAVFDTYIGKAFEKAVRTSLNNPAYHSNDGADRAMGIDLSHQLAGASRQRAVGRSAPLTAAPLAGGAAIRSGARSGSGLWSPPAQFPTRLGYGDRRHDAFQLPSLLSPNPLRSARPIYRS